MKVLKATRSVTSVVRQLAQLLDRPRKREQLHLIMDVLTAAGLSGTIRDDRVLHDEGQGIGRASACTLHVGNKHVIGMNVNIVQHPNALPKMVALRNNILQYRTDRTLLYETDTDHGSSGAAVFNDSWELVALHHFGEPSLERKERQRGRADQRNLPRPRGSIAFA